MWRVMFLPVGPTFEPMRYIRLLDVTHGHFVSPYTQIAR